MNYRKCSLFADKETQKVRQKDDFEKSCLPLSEMLDSVRHVEGFPIGRDEDILAISDPPYYTVCPNPYLGDIIKHYGKPYDEVTDTYERTPFVFDLSEGKNNPIYKAHSYHTKVPHKAIMPFIKHYTEPGDIVFDGFCGTGMTGVAAQMLGRRAILCDLSPTATFIAYNYNTPVDVSEFKQEARHILAEIHDECGWMYETMHTDGKTKGNIHYSVWSDVFLCPYCGNEYVFWDVAVDKAIGTIKDDYQCPHCNAEMTKRQSNRAKINFWDEAIGEEITMTKQVPVLINYSVGKKRYEKTPDQADLDLITAIEESAIPYGFPTDIMPKGYNTEQPKRSHGFTHIHHFYTKRNLWVLSILKNKNIDFIHSSMVPRSSKMVKTLMSNYFAQLKGETKGGWAGTPLMGTLFIPSIGTEVSPIAQLESRINAAVRLQEFKKQLIFGNVFLGVNSSSDLSNICSNSLDYIFTDPPFGDNIMYSELNFLWESWLKVFTNNKSEAIINKNQGKNLPEYKELMTACLKEMYRILKPNRWITVVFHNSKAAVWNAIQDAMTRAGFVIALVTVLDKKQGSFKQVTSSGAVKNDLVINAYKPKKQLEENFLKKAGTGLERDFVADLLDHLPLEPNIGRTEQMLYSKMIAHYVQRGYEICLNARQFYTLLKDYFKLIDGYWFTDKDVLKYEEWKRKQGLAGIKEIKTGQQILFVNDERSALVWLYSFLETPKTFNDIFTAYSKAVTGNEDAIPELRVLLDNNFIFEDKCYRRPKDGKEKETIEAQRERELARAFERLLADAQSGGKKLKGVRKEAVIFGFTKAYQEKRYNDILAVAKKLDKNILETNSEFNDFVEIAKVKTGEEL